MVATLAWSTKLLYAGPVSTGMGDHIGVQLLVREIYLSLTNHTGHPSVGRRNEYRSKGGDALRLGSKGRYGVVCR